MCDETNENGLDSTLQEKDVGNYNGKVRHRISSFYFYIWLMP